MVRTREKSVFLVGFVSRPLSKKSLNWHLSSGEWVSQSGHIETIASCQHRIRENTFYLLVRSVSIKHRQQKSPKLTPSLSEGWVRTIAWWQDIVVWWGQGESRCLSWGAWAEIVSQSHAGWLKHPAAAWTLLPPSSRNWRRPAFWGFWRSLVKGVFLEDNLRDILLVCLLESESTRD